MDSKKDRLNNEQNLDEEKCGKKKKKYFGSYFYDFGLLHGDGEGAEGEGNRKKKRKKKKKKTKKKDACYHKVKSRYDVWPSAYASGALVKCRKVGAKNWGNKSKKKKKNESIIREEFKPHMMYDPKSAKSEMTHKSEDHERLSKKGYTHVDPSQLRKILRDEGGASGMDPFLKAIGKDMEEEIIKTLEAMPDVGQHKDKDYILDDKKQVQVVKERKKKNTLYHWFKGSKSVDGKPGWVDVTDGDSCAREEGEKATPKCVSRSKYDSMSKKERESAARRKRNKDPNQPKKKNAAKPTYVSTDKKKKKVKENINMSDINEANKIDKDKMPCNKPKRTPKHPKKSHVVKACSKGKKKIIRFGEQGAKTAGKPKKGESSKMKKKRKSFKARHGKNIKKGKMSAAYWANKVKWESLVSDIENLIIEIIEEENLLGDNNEHH